jgi:HEPN superfamily RiboL-PSP-like protein
LKGAVQALDSDLQKLREEINLGPILGSAINAAHSGNKILRMQLSTRSRRLAYVHGMISIYGLIEEHVDNLIMEVASTYQQLYTYYDDLPEFVRSSHHEYSLRILLDGDKIRLREPISETVNLNILTGNYNNAPLRLNTSAFTYSTANYRHPHIIQLMRRLDLDISTLIAAPAVKSALADSGLEFRDAEALLHDLVERRNEIAHSYQALELLEIGVLVAYLDVVACYLKELFSVASNHLLHILAAQHLKPIGTLVKCWTDWVGVDMTSGSVKAPCSAMFIKDERVFVRTVASLQSEGASIVGILEPSEDVVKLGMSVDEPLPPTAEGAQVFVLPDRWLYLSI